MVVRKHLQRPRLGKVRINSDGLSEEWQGTPIIPLHLLKLERLGVPAIGVEGGGRSEPAQLRPRQRIRLFPELSPQLLTQAPDRRDHRVLIASYRVDGVKNAAIIRIPGSQKY